MNANDSLKFVLGAATVLLSACHDELLPKHYEKISYSSDESDEIRRLRIDVGSGDVEITASDRDTISGKASVRGDSNHLSQEVVGDELVLKSDCVTRSGCTINVYLSIPTGLELDIDTGSGDIEIVGQEGDGKLATGSGDVRLRDVFADSFDVDTGSGDVDGSKLQLLNATFDTGSGDANLKWDDQPESVHIETGSGEVSLGLPSGEYDIDLATGSGEIELEGITQSSDADSQIDVQTGSGDIRVYER